MACLALSLVLAVCSSSADQPGDVFHVTQTYDDRPFDYRIESVEEKATFSVLRLSYPSPIATRLASNNTIPAEYYLPQGIRPGEPKRPAVISIHILDGNMELVRMTCSVLASRGIPAIFFMLPYYGARAPTEGPEAMAADPDLFLGAVSQAIEDVRRTVDLLASRPEVDPTRIGITGISLGGIVAATASGRDPRLHRAMLVLAGGDLKTIIDHARETAALSQTIRQLPVDRQSQIRQTLLSVDPLTWAGPLRDRAREGRVLMVNAAEDEVIPRPCTAKLAEVLGIADRVEWLDGLGHYTAMAALPRILDRMVAFFGQDMPPRAAVSPLLSPDGKRSPPQVVASLLRQLATLLVDEPGEGRCHFIDLEVTARPAGQDAIEGRLRLIRGSGKRFKLECEAPMVGRVAMGQGEYPWMLSGRKLLIKGVKNAVPASQDPLIYAQRRHLVKLQVAAGAAAGVAIAPDVLDQVITAKEEAAVEGRRAIRITLKKEDQGSLQLVLKDDGRTAERIGFDVPGMTGTVAIRSLETDTAAVDGMFRPRPGLEEKEVEQADVLRMFAAMFNFAMEAVE